MRKEVCTEYILRVKSTYQVQTGLCPFILVPYYSVVHTGMYRYVLGTYNCSRFQMAVLPAGGSGNACIMMQHGISEHKHNCTQKSYFTTRQGHTRYIPGIHYAYTMQKSHVSFLSSSVVCVVHNWFITQPIMKST